MTTTYLPSRSLETFGFDVIKVAVDMNWTSAKLFARIQCGSHAVFPFGV